MHKTHGLKIVENARKVLRFFKLFRGGMTAGFPSGIGSLTFYLALDGHSQNPSQNVYSLHRVQRE